MHKSVLPTAPRTGGELPQQTVLTSQGRGGRRLGAGRKPMAVRRVPHRAREMHHKHYPVHITMRARGFTYLRSQRMYAVIRGAISRGQKTQFHICQFSVQGDHIHFIVEAADAKCLAGGMGGLAVRIARQVNRALRRRGRFWRERYHSRALRSPRAVRTALVYVLFNHKKHVRADRAPAGLDPCSSAEWFDGFRSPMRDRGPKREARHRARNGLAPVVPASTWLGAVGWKHLGLLEQGEGPAHRRERTFC